MNPARVSNEELNEILGSRIRFRIGEVVLEGMLVYRGKRLSGKKDVPHFSFVSYDPVEESQPFPRSSLRKNEVYETTERVRMLSYTGGVRVPSLRKLLYSLE